MKAIILILAIVIFSSDHITVESDAFKQNEMIPTKYTCMGEDVSPPLTFANIPPQTKSLAIIMDDPDTSRGTFVHWVAWNIPVTSAIAENEILGIQGKNGKGTNGYFGPCPPSGIHRYFFKIYALDTMLKLDVNSDKQALLAAMESHILASGELVGLYKK